MSVPSPENAEIANLSDDYIRDLKAESQRYDITLAPDFVISVLPNGIKTWAFIYDFQGRHRRKTLGVFPDMNFDEAKTSLKKSRTEIVRMDEPTVAPDEFGRLPAVLGGGHYVPKERKRSRKGIRFLMSMGALAMLAVVVGLGYVWQNRSTINAPTPATIKKNAPFKLDTSGIKSTHPSNTKPNEERTNDDRADEKNSAPKSTAPTPPKRTTTTAAVPSPKSVASAATVASKPTNTSKQFKPPAPSTTSAGSSSTQSVSSLTSTPSAPSAPTPQPTQRVAANSQPASEKTVVNNPSAVVLKAATAFGGSVARATLTSGVNNLEPIDRIGPEVSYKDSGFTRVFYYTELREFSEGNVVHRWQLNGETMEEVALRVNKSWRWRTYSNKDIGPGLTGEWTVSTIDASGTVLNSESFTYGY